MPFGSVKMPTSAGSPPPLVAAEASTRTAAPSALPCLYQARNLSFRYRAQDGHDVEALCNVSYEVRRGEFLSVIGPSGCGKTTLLKLMSGLLRPSQGELLHKGQALSGSPKGIGMAFQDALLLPWRNVIDNVLLPIEILGLPRREHVTKAETLLATVGLSGFEKKASWQLSGGMRQRVSLCRALITDPELLLLDEPFGALDAFTREELWLVLQELHLRTGATVVLITHQLHESVFLSNRVIVLSSRPGRVVYEQEVDLPRPRAVDVAYTAEFISYVDALRRRIDR
jgi:NitT/TauT family transport system ATP-binding protein